MKYIYFGSYKNGKYDGKGLLLNASLKQYYDGEFKNGDINGYGKLYTLGYNYRGRFRNGNMHGNGILYQHETSYNLVNVRSQLPIFNKYQKGVYIGFFKKGIFRNGIFLNQEGERYFVTSFWNREKHGHSLIFSRRTLETQMYQNDKKNGEYTFRTNLHFIRTNFYNDSISGIYEAFSNRHYHQLFYQKGILQKRSLFSYKYKHHFIIEMDKKGIENRIMNVYHQQQKYKFPYDTDTFPREYLCPIGHDLMIQPCRTEVGQCYEYKNIKRWFEECKQIRDPMTNIPLYSRKLELDLEKKFEIFEYLCTRYFRPPNTIHLPL